MLRFRFQTLLAVSCLRMPAPFVSPSDAIRLAWRDNKMPQGVQACQIKTRQPSFKHGW